MLLRNKGVCFVTALSVWADATGMQLCPVLHWESIHCEAKCVSQRRILWGDCEGGEHVTWVSKPSSWAASGKEKEQAWGPQHRCSEIALFRFQNGVVVCLESPDPFNIRRALSLPNSQMLKVPGEGAAMKECISSESSRHATFVSFQRMSGILQ